MPISICVPTPGTMPWQFVASALNLQVPAGSEWHIVASASVYHAREVMVRSALESNHDYVFFLDSDMLVQPDILPRLMEHDVDIVSGMAFKRAMPYSPCFYEQCEYNDGNINVEPYRSWESGQLMEVAGVGMACTLIKTDVFRSMNPPLFLPMHEEIAEDLAFCIRAREAGYKIYVDTNINAGHLSQCVIDESISRAVIEQENHTK